LKDINIIINWVDDTVLMYILDVSAVKPKHRRAGVRLGALE
jgi:hypothetical protein